MDRLAPVFVAALLLGFSVHPVDAENADVPSSHVDAQGLTIRTYAAEGDELPASTRAIVSRLLAEAGIQARWTHCTPPHADVACALPLSNSELAMRLVRERVEPAAAPQPLAVGTSLIDNGRRHSVLATLYLNRIDRLSTFSGTATDVILARAIAHEAAHLLLGSVEHGLAGLMRPIWTRAMLRSDADSDWVFTADEGRRLRDALKQRR